MLEFFIMVVGGMIVLIFSQKALPKNNNKNEKGQIIDRNGNVLETKKQRDEDGK